MSQFSRLILLLLTSVALCGCSTNPPIETNVSSFHSFGQTTRPSGSIAIVPHSSVADGLEFKHYAGKILGWLAQKGLYPASSASAANYLGTFSYRIDEGRQALVSAPILGQTGGGTALTTSPYGTATTFAPATFGVVGSSMGSVVLFTRFAELTIRNQKTGQVVWVGRARSEGGSSEIARVLPAMIQSMLQDFPNESGRTKTVALRD